jgi:4a-hydroxytetrahydrobiopterin dehydratase
MATPKALSAAEIDAALKALPDWKREGDAIRAAYTLASFRDAVAFIARLAFEAEALNHHPEIANTYNRVSFRLATHDAGDKATDKDIELAKRISAAVRPFLAAR